MEQVKIIAISGSLREGSYNTKILQLAKRQASEKSANVYEISLRELDLPIYNKDIADAGFPESVLKLKNAVESADMLLIATPEYNHSIPGGLKNAIDWLSRGKNSLNGKTAAIFGSSDGNGGTVRSQMHLREVLATLNVYILPYPEVLIRNADEKFDEHDNFTEERTVKQLDKLITKTINFTEKLKSEI